MDDLLRLSKRHAAGLCHAHEGDVQITPEGKAFAEADIPTRKDTVSRSGAGERAAAAADEARRSKIKAITPCRWSSSTIFSTNTSPRPKSNSQLDTALELGPLRRYFQLRSGDRQAPCWPQPDIAAIEPKSFLVLMTAHHRQSPFGPRLRLGNHSCTRAVALRRSADLARGIRAFLRAVLAVTHYWIAPVQPQANIDLSPASSDVCDVLGAAHRHRLFDQPGFQLVYGYIAAYNAKAERVMIPLLDTLQSIPVLSFLPGVMLSMVALFPTRQLGLELGSILLIFTGQVWNMAFSFYSSLKPIPREMHEAADSLPVELVATVPATGSAICASSAWSGIR